MDIFSGLISEGGIFYLVFIVILYLLIRWSKSGSDKNKIKKYKETVANESHNFDAAYTLAATYKRIGQDEQALGVYIKFIEANPKHNEAYSEMAYLLEEMDRYDEAETIYRDLIEVDPTDIDAYIDLAYFLSEQDRNEEATSVYKQMAILFPSEIDTYDEWHISLEQLKEINQELHQKLVEEYKAVLEQNKNESKLKDSTEFQKIYSRYFN